MLGNDPFSEIGIKTEDNTNIILICSKELKKELIDAQGKLYLIQFSEKKVLDKVPAVVVEKAIPMHPFRRPPIVRAAVTDPRN